MDVYEAGEHEHSQQKAARGITQRTKSEIDALFKDGIQKPRGILGALRNRGCQAMPTKSQLTNYLSTMKIREYGKHTISLGELSAWAESRKVVPEDDDAPFVCGFDCDYDERESKFFRICMSVENVAAHPKPSQRW